jgi:hypothetical protein
VSNKVDLGLVKKSKQEEQLLITINAVKTMKTLYQSMKEEGFSEEFIAIYLANLTKG